MRSSILNAYYQELEKEGMTGEAIQEEDRLKKTRTGGPSSPLTPAFLSTNLTQLKLSGSGLSQLPANLPPSDTIIEVDLSRNRLKDVPQSLSSLKNLRHLNLSCNLLHQVPEVLYQGLHVLKTLNLSENQLVTFQQPPLCLPLLQVLDLSGNKIVAPPPWLLQDLPSSLNTLDLSRNPCFLLMPGYKSQLQDSSLVINKVCESVKTLRLVNTGIRGLVHEKFISNFKNLIKLDVGNNDLRVNANFSDFTMLPNTIQELSLHGTGLGCLPKSVITLPNLRKLDISNTSINWLSPPAAGDLRNLTVLRAESCRMYLLPQEVNLLTNLKELYLSNNEMSTSYGFEELVSLEVLDLYHNQFVSVPDFKNLSRLRALDFCQNYTDPPQLVILEKEVIPYTTLRECLRSNYCDGSFTRLDGQRVVLLHESDADEERSSNFSDPQEEFFSDQDLEDESSINNDGESYSLNNSVQPPTLEVWDIDNDDNYDPTEINPSFINKVSLNSETEEDLLNYTSHEVMIHPHYFIPFRTASPAVPPSQLDPPDEGQFDD